MQHYPDTQACRPEAPADVVPITLPDAPDPVVANPCALYVSGATLFELEVRGLLTVRVST